MTIFRAPADLEKLRYCAELGIDRVTFSLPAAGREAVLPILDEWAVLQRQLNG